jgi:hypothetical protein
MRKQLLQYFLIRGARHVSRCMGLVSVFFVGLTCAHAENTVLILAFGGDPGSPVPHAYNYGVPATDATTYALRIPTVDNDMAAIFYDSELSISSATKIVERVSAARAYRTMNECNEARAIVLSKLAEGLPLDYSLGDANWQRQSADGTVVGGVECENPRHYPMPVLRLTIALSGT